MSLAGLLAATCLFFLIHIVFRRYKLHTRGLKQLPGPPGHVPWIRNAFQIPPTYQWLAFNRWHEAYGICGSVLLD
jgi:hypothetical protein